MAVVRKLADEIGSHPIGSPEAVQAAEYLASTLRTFPRVEVELQDAEGDTRIGVWPEVNFHYRVHNVIARLKGKSDAAILINAHYDSPVEGKGGSDNGIGTAAMVETMRALSTMPQLEWSVILCLNGGEEMGSAGAAGFLSHRYAKDVRAFIDTDGSGSGKANLIQASANVPTLLSAYARSVRFPQATVFGNDFVQSGLTQSSGDFEPLSRAGLVGLDVAAVKDTWGVHTQLDVSSRLQPGTLQDLGNTILSVTRELATHPPNLAVHAERSVYFDVLGQTTLVYSMRTARWLCVAAIGLLIVTVGFAQRRKQVSLKLIAASTLWTLGSLVAGLLCAILSAVIVSVIFHRPHGFYATPWLIVPSFLMAGLCGVIAVHALWKQRAEKKGIDAEQGALAAWISGLLLVGIFLVLCSAASLGLGYLFLFSLVPEALALGVGIAVPRLRWRLFLLGAAMALVSFIHLAVGMIPALIGLMIGMAPDPVPGDIKMAVLLWLFVLAPLGLLGMAALHHKGELRALLRVCLVVAGIGLFATSIVSPYSDARPKRMTVVHVTEATRTALLLQSDDHLPLAPALAGIPQAQPVPSEESWSQILPPGWLPPYSHKLPAEPSPIAPPRLEVISSTEDKAQGKRTVRLRLWATGWVTMLHIQRAPIASWSLALPIPQPLPGQKTITMLFAAPSPQGQEFTLDLVGSTAVEVTLVQAHRPEPDPLLQDVTRKLPRWTTPNARSLQVVKTTL